MIYTVTLNAAVDRVLRVPGFAPGGVRRAELVELLAAGKGFNVSRILAELGAPSAAAGLVGESELRFYEGSFRALGVPVILAGFAAPTRSNVTVLDPQSGTETHLRERGPEVPEQALGRLEVELLPRLAAGDVLAFCGSLPPGLAPERAARLLEGARSRGARLFADASGPALKAVRELGPEVLSVNAEELGELSGGAVGGPGPAAEAARELLGAPQAVVLVKLGAGGAVAASRAGAWHARAPEVCAGNTVGAGDAFNAGYLAREAAGLAKALGFAVACGSAQVASGALGRLRRAEAERLTVETVAL
jgi:1-phosphofructokinase